MVSIGLTWRLRHCCHCHRLWALDVPAGGWTHSDPVNDPHGCHSDAAWWKSSFVSSSFFIFFFSPNSIKLTWTAIQIPNLSVQKAGTARTTDSVFCSLRLRDPSLLSAADRECTVNYHLFNTSLALLFNMQHRAFLRRHITHDISYWELALAVYQSFSV